MTTAHLRESKISGSHILTSSHWYTVKCQHEDWSQGSYLLHCLLDTSLSEMTLEEKKKNPLKETAPLHSLLQFKREETSFNTTGFKKFLTKAKSLNRRYQSFEFAAVSSLQLMLFTPDSTPGRH